MYKSDFIGCNVTLRKNVKEKVRVKKEKKWNEDLKP